MRRIFRRHLFLLIGLLSLGLLFLPSGLGRGPMQVLIMPMYLVWLGWTMAEVAIVGPYGVHGVPHAIGVVVSGLGILAGLAPYALADYVLERWRRE
jgi:hypothetical protein